VIEGKGFGFVEMASGDQAQSAKEALNGTDYNGRTMRVDEARPPKPRDDRGGGGGGGRRGGGPGRRF
jgi:RNA recognition motif-containing protein